LDEQRRPPIKRSEKVSFGRTWKRRKPVRKAFLPWPGFLLLDQYLPDSLLTLQAAGFCPLQIADKSYGVHCMCLDLKGRHCGFPFPHPDSTTATRQRSESKPEYEATAKAQPAMFPDPNKGHCKILHGFYPSLVSPMGVETP
jgi:hypothetical protein